ncbi:MAG: 7-cyano-7-deazaguanine synthase QueC [Acidobacteria bacterium]|jgi:7-cyano-7-deazaguanine synthase|nr:7-cyano-7-deazaguanine synthase QueC [Acidobacteriota bacterium]
MNKGAIVLFSGGIDSTTALYWARNKFDPVRALVFDYGQQHRVEVTLAKKAAAGLGVECDVVPLPLRGLLRSALLADGRSIPASLAEARSRPGLPATYVPFRNGIFLALAAAVAESHGSRHLVTGFNSIDTPDYPDTSEHFRRKMAAAINEGTAASRGGPRFKVHAPLLRLNKKEIIALGFELGADYAHSVSCYRGSEVPCGRCPSCDIRARAFAELGRGDPLVERLRKEGNA